jgi:hypothetical protein
MQGLVVNRTQGVGMKIPFTPGIGLTPWYLARLGQVETVAAFVEVSVAQLVLHQFHATLMIAPRAITLFVLDLLISDDFSRFVDLFRMLRVIRGKWCVLFCLLISLRFRRDGRRILSNVGLARMSMKFEHEYVIL